jgi:NAD(P)-dependent dehydrogenase (short-subunit alcohol dehydrogenase family)
MPATDAPEPLRANLLAGEKIMLAGAAAPPPGPSERLRDAVRAGCAALGARVSDCELLPGASRSVEEAAVEAAVGRALAADGGIDLLVVDCASVFACAAGHHDGGAVREPGDGRDEDARAALRLCLEASWSITRAVASQAFLARERGGRIVYLAPASGADRSEIAQHAEAARAGLENLGRTLSIEWARHGITLVTIAPGDATTAAQLATLTAYLASPAGGYFSGCLLDLRGPGGM